jgi:hypothetical protein
MGKVRITISEKYSFDHFHWIFDFLGTISCSFIYIVVCLSALNCTDVNAEGVTNGQTAGYL